MDENCKNGKHRVAVFAETDIDGDLTCSLCNAPVTLAEDEKAHLRSRQAHLAGELRG